MPAPYNLISGVDANYNFPPQVLDALFASTGFNSKLTTAIAGNQAVIDGAASQALNGVGLIPKWKASTAYAVGTWTVSPRGNFMICATAHTSASSFSQATEANWTFINGGPRGWLPFNADFELYRNSPGVWLMPSQAYVDTYLNWPSDLPKLPGIFIVHGDYVNGSTIIFGQTIWTYGTSYGKRERTTRSGAAWNPWVDPYATGTSTVTGIEKDYALSNNARRDAFINAHGGSIGLGNTCGVAIRLDHGAVNARDKVIDKFVANAMPWSWAVNPGSSRLALAENGNLGWSFYQDACQNKGGQIVNHGMNHIDATTLAAKKVELVDSQVLLQTNIPLQTVDLFAVPGVGGTNMDGWTSTNTTEHFTSNFDGAKLVLDQHAFSSGYTPGLYRDLDGNPKNGETHYTLDTATLADVQTRVGLAQSYRAGIQFMLHPSLIDTEGYITTAELHSILDWLAAERDAGRVTLLSLGGLLMADYDSYERHNLLRNPEFIGTSGWNTAGYTGFTGVAPTRTAPSVFGYAQSTTSAAQLSQNIDLTNRAHFAGRHREIVATFTADASGAVARLQLEHLASSSTITKDVTLAPNETRTVRFIGLMPIWSGSNLPTFRAGRLSGGAVKVTNPGVLAV